MDFYLAASSRPFTHGAGKLLNLLSCIMQLSQIHIPKDFIHLRNEFCLKKGNLIRIILPYKHFPHYRENVLTHVEGGGGEFYILFLDGM